MCFRNATSYRYVTGAAAGAAASVREFASFRRNSINQSGGHAGGSPNKDKKPHVVWGAAREV
jgi:hypothetical protein